MSMVIVVTLKIIQIEHHQGEIMAVSPRPPKFLLEPFHKIVMVE